MYLLAKEDMSKIAPLFAGWNETMIWSCLDGCMGNAWADSNKNPQIAVISTVGFTFFAGDAHLPEAETIVRDIFDMTTSSGLQCIPLGITWNSLLEKVYKDKQGYEYFPYTRYGMKKEKNLFDYDKLKNYVSRIPKDYIIVPMNEELYLKSKQPGWVGGGGYGYRDFEEFEKRGLGYVIMYHNQEVGSVATFTYYNEGIEIDIEIAPEHRRKGLALSSCALMIIE
jgi:hypothetical protein